MATRATLKVTELHTAAATAGAIQPAALTQQCETDHFVVSYDNAVANGPALAQSVLDNCEGYYTSLVNTFGGITPPPPPLLFPEFGLPFHVEIVSGSNGGRHGGCNNTGLIIDAFDGNDAGLINYLVVAETDEVFMAAQHKSWDCGSSQGVALSRCLRMRSLGPMAVKAFALRIGG
jgi:hypothetical protein